MTENENPIPPVTRDDPAAHSGDVVAENVATLKALFPSIITDGKVDFDVLRQLLGDAVEEGQERYGLNWKGKARARAFALTPSLGTLRPAKEDSKDWETTKNIVIEGDNLEVLKLLRKSYAGKVKLIYIDPPYNTGKDFVYPDNYTESLANYEALTGQRGEDGARLVSNKETSGRFHTDWLNMMYPRLMLAKELLRDDGLITVSLNDSELPNLLQIMEQIFGPSNFIANIIWQKKQSPQNDAVNVSDMHDFIVCFARNAKANREDKGGWNRIKFKRSAEQEERYENRDDDPRGPWTSSDLTCNKTSAERPNLYYPVIRPSDNRELWPSTTRVWGYEKSVMEKLIAEDRISWGTGADSRPRLKVFRSEVDDGVVPSTWWTREFAGDNQEAKRELRALFAEAEAFGTPKPVALIKRILEMSSQVNGSDVVLDFFAGSGTTGHAVMAQNAADGGSRRFVLVQLPEPLDPEKSEQKTAADFCDKLGKPRNIAELTKERLRRAGAKVQAEHPEAKLDTGFRAYKLATSNLKPWQPGDDLAADLLNAASNILPDRSEDDLLVELLLKTGINLTLPGETRTIAGRTVHVFGGGTLVVCLADIPAAEAQALGDGIADWLAAVEPPAPTTFFFKDNGFDAGGGRKGEARAMLAATLRQRLGEDAIEKLGAI